MAKLASLGESPAMFEDFIPAAVGCIVIAGALIGAFFGGRGR